MRYWQTAFIGDGSDDDVFRPAGLDDVLGWHLIDFRPDSTVPDGICVIAVPDDIVPAGAVLLGDGPDVTVNARRLGNAFDVNLDAKTLPDVLAELLLVHASDEDPGRWNALRPTIEGRYEVWLGEQLVDIPVVSGGSVFTETFNVADVDPLVNGAQTTWVGTLNNIRVISNQADLHTISANNRARCQADCDTANNYAQFVIPSADTTATNAWFVLCRYQSGADTGYVSYQGDGATLNNTLLRKVVTATNTTLGSGTHTKSTNEVLRTQANGSTIQQLIDGTVQTTVTDTAITTGTRGGVGLFAAATGRVTVDSFEMGDLGFPYPKIIVV